MRSSVMDIIHNSARPFPHIATGYEDAMQFVELVRLRIGPHVPRGRDFLIDLVNAHASECKLLANTCKSFRELSLLYIRPSGLTLAGPRYILR